MPAAMITKTGFAIVHFSFFTADRPPTHIFAARLTKTGIFYRFIPFVPLEYFIIIQDHIIKHKMFAAGAPFFVEKHENRTAGLQMIARLLKNC